MYSVQCGMHSEQCTMYSVLCTVRVQGTLYYTLYIGLEAVMLYTVNCSLGECCPGGGERGRVELCPGQGRTAAGPAGGGLAELHVHVTVTINPVILFTYLILQVIMIIIPVIL